MRCQVILSYIFPRTSLLYFFWLVPHSLLCTPQLAFRLNLQHELLSFLSLVASHLIRRLLPAMRRLTLWGMESARTGMQTNLLHIHSSIFPGPTKNFISRYGRRYSNILVSTLEMPSLSDALGCGTFCVDSSSNSTLINRQTDLVGFTFVRQLEPHCFCYFDKGAVFLHASEDIPYAGAAYDAGEGQVEGSDGRSDHVCYRNVFHQPSRSPTVAPTLSPIAPSNRWASPILFVCVFETRLTLTRHMLCSPTSGPTRTALFEDNLFTYIGENHPN